MLVFRNLEIILRRSLHDILLLLFHAIEGRISLLLHFFLVFHVAIELFLELLHFQPNLDKSASNMSLSRLLQDIAIFDAKRGFLVEHLLTRLFAQFFIINVLSHLTVGRGVPLILLFLLVDLVEVIVNIMGLEDLLILVIHDLLLCLHFSN
jgi:hypothetical protein